MKSSRMALGILLLAIVACPSKVPEPPASPPPPPPPVATLPSPSLSPSATPPDCGPSAGSKTIPVEIAGQKVKLVNPADNTVVANPETDNITWDLVGPTAHEIIVTFVDPTYLEGAPGNSKKQKKLKQKMRGSECQEFKYTISVNDPSIGPLDPVIIVRY